LKWNFATFSLPPTIENEDLLLEEEQHRFNEKDIYAPEDAHYGYYQFGKAFDVDLDLKDGTWMVLPDGGRLWRLALRLPIPEFFLPLIFI
jgi:hypothetical protein